MIILLFIFNTYTWYSKYINVSIKNTCTLKERILFGRAFGVNKVPEIIIWTLSTKQKLIGPEKYLLQPAKGRRLKKVYFGFM